MSEVTKCVVVITSGVVTAVMMIVSPDVAPFGILLFGVVTFIIARN